MNAAMVKTALEEAMQIDGAVGACLVDCASGMCLGTAGGGDFNLDVAAACNTEVVKAQIRTMAQLGLRDRIEDMLITLGGQYHLIRMVNGGNSLFLYLALNKAGANLGLARLQLSQVEQKLA